MRTSITRLLKACSQAGALVLMACVLLGTSGCPPEVKSFTPVKGPAGTPVVITGKNFADAAAGNVVKFNGKAAATVTRTPDGKLVATVPADATTGRITVTVGTQTGTSTSDFTVEAEQQGGADKKWTFMVYLDADNNLEEPGLTDFMEMAAVPNSDKLNIVVQMDRVPGWTDAYGDWTNTRRFLVKNGSTPANTPLQDVGELNMGDPTVLTDFVKWAMTSYPADHYALVIWNHGGGWRVLQETVQVRTTRKMAALRAAMAPGSSPTLPVDVIKAVAYDETSNDIMYMKEVQNALESALSQVGGGAKLDIVGFDACLMGMIEVAYALRNVTNIMVASEQTEPGDGWPYTDVLLPVTSNAYTSPPELATLIVNKYGDSYSASAGITQAAVDVTKITDVAAKVDAFTEKATSEWVNLKAARNSAFTYHTSEVPKSYWGADIWGFADETQKGTTSADIKSAAIALRDAVKGAVFAERHGSMCNGSHGLAIYFPATKSKYDDDPEHTGYTDGNTFNPVDFVSQHKWDTWLTEFYLH